MATRCICKLHVTCADTCTSSANNPNQPGDDTDNSGDGSGGNDKDGVVDKCDCPGMSPLLAVCITQSTCELYISLTDSGDRDRLGSQSEDEDSDGLVVGLAVGLPLLVLCCVCASILVGLVAALLYRRRRGSTDIAMEPLKNQE